MSDLRQLSVRIPIDLYDELVTLAKNSRCSLTDLTLRVLYAGLTLHDVKNEGIDPGQLVDIIKRLELLEQEVKKLNQAQDAEPSTRQNRTVRREKLDFPHDWETLPVAKLRRLASGRLSKTEYLRRDALVAALADYLDQHPDEKPEP